MADVELAFVNKPYNNHYYEWGKNCATLGYDEDQTLRIFDGFGKRSIEDIDMFWEGYHDGPRSSGEIYSLSISQG